jgi:hypothetical protein
LPPDPHEEPQALLFGLSPDPHEEPQELLLGLSPDPHEEPHEGAATPQPAFMQLCASLTATYDDFLFHPFILSSPLIFHLLFQCNTLTSHDIPTF